MIKTRNIKGLVKVNIGKVQNLKLNLVLMAFVILTVYPMVSHAQIEFSGELESISNLNSIYYERNPVFHPNGTDLYFERANHPDNIKGIQDLGDIWFSRYDSVSGWSEPTNIGAPVNTEFINSILGFINGGKYMLIAQQYGNQNIYSSNGISISEYRNGKWQKPINLEIPYFKKNSMFISGSVAADGQHLVLCLQSLGTYGVEDVYISELMDNGNWGELKNVGKSINTPFQELSGFISPDNKYLIFSSNGHSGEGSFDLYISERIGEGWKNWSTPVSLSSRINSEGAEHSFSFLPGSDIAYLTSTQNSDGYGDIKRINIGKDTTTIIVEESDKQELAPGFVRISGKVIDAKTKSGIRSELNIMIEQGGTSLSLESMGNGTFELDVPSGSFLEIVSKKEKYLTYKEAMSSDDILTQENFVIELEPLIVGNTITLKHVLFERAKDVFLKGSESELDLLVQMMTDNPDIKIFLAGHTDNTGNSKASIELSQHRVDAVKRYLVEKGINSKRISGKGFGGTKPIASNASEETRKMNRRVEFSIVE